MDTSPRQASSDARSSCAAPACATASRYAASASAERPSSTRIAASSCAARARSGACPVARAATRRRSASGAAAATRPAARVASISLARRSSAAIVVRTASKVLCNVAAARLSGSTERKGLLTGLALTPMSAFAILLLEQSRLYGFEPAQQVLTALAFMMLVQELFGPLVTQRALNAAAETHVTQE